MKPLTHAFSRIPRWLLWGLAPMAAVAVMTIGVDRLEARTRDMLAQNEAATAASKPATGAPVGETAQVR